MHMCSDELIFTYQHHKLTQYGKTDFPPELITNYVYFGTMYQRTCYIPEVTL